MAEIGENITTDENRTPAQIRRDIDSEKEIIAVTADRLKENLHEKLSWRFYVNKYPFVSLGAAAGMGFLISGALPKPTSRVERVAEAIRDKISVKETQASSLKLLLLGIVTKVVTQWVKSSVFTPEISSNRGGDSRKPVESRAEVQPI